jgi:hypothetical protein
LCYGQRPARLVEYSSTPVGTFGASCVVRSTDRGARNAKLPALQIACTIDNHISLIYDNPNPPLPPHPPATPPTPPRATAGAAVQGSASPAASPNVIHPHNYIRAERVPGRAGPRRAVLCRYGRGRVLIHHSYRLMSCAGAAAASAMPSSPCCVCCLALPCLALPNYSGGYHAPSCYTGRRADRDQRPRRRRRRSAGRHRHARRSA